MHQAGAIGLIPSRARSTSSTISTRIAFGPTHSLQPAVVDPSQPERYSEVGIGGSTGQSLCAISHNGGRVQLHKDVLAISYGLKADALLITARRHADAAASNQVLLALRPGSFTLEQTSGWNTIGLRGTCSAGFLVHADESDDMLFPDGWATIVEQTGGPATEILLNSVWLGIAEAAAHRAHRFVRADARRNIGTTPMNAPLLAEVAVTLGSVRSLMSSFLDRFDAATGTEEIHSAATILALRNLKLSTTTLAIEIVTKASMICGFAGYHRDSDFSMDRSLRDVFGGPLMANNARFMNQNAHLLLAMRDM